MDDHLLFLLEPGVRGVPLHPNQPLGQPLLIDPGAVAEAVEAHVLR